MSSKNYKINDLHVTYITSRHITIFCYRLHLMGIKSEMMYDRETINFRSREVPGIEVYARIRNKHSR